MPMFCFVRDSETGRRWLNERRSDLRRLYMRMRMTRREEEQAVYRLSDRTAACVYRLRLLFHILTETLATF